MSEPIEPMRNPWGLLVAPSRQQILRAAQDKAVVAAVHQAWGHPPPIEPVPTNVALSAELEARAAIDRTKAAL